MKENDSPLYTLTVEQYKTLIRSLLLESGKQPTTPPDNGEELLKMPEIVKILKVSRVTIFSWINSGKLKAHHINSRLYIKRKDVQAALIHHKRKNDD